MLAVLGLAAGSLTVGCSDMVVGHAASKVKDTGSPLISQVYFDDGRVEVTMPRGSGAAEAQRVWCTLLRPNGLDKTTTVLKSLDRKWPQPLDCDVYGVPSAASTN
jgi:hypothetical protein